MNYFSVFRSVIGFVFVSVFIYGKQEPDPGFADTRPNIILIMSDDMGYSDLGCYGGEISTPNLDALAAGGLRYTQFYNMARCCPTRASLLTGLYPHKAGLGWMTAVDHGLPGYGGEINKNTVTIAEVLQDAGYSTWMTGKWHVAKDPKNEVEKYNWPIQRGFEKYYGIILGAANYFDPGILCRDNTLITTFTDKGYKSENYYFTDAVSDNSVQYISQRDRKKPFFMYVAYTAAHWPMQAPEETIKKYKGVYKNGWENIRSKRLEKMKQSGIINDSVQLPEWDSYSWEDEKNQPALARRMETYAAMVDIMDQGIGRIVKKLKAEGIYENTIILYLQDNGGCAELIGLGEDRPAANDTSGLRALKYNEIQTTGRPLITRDGRIVRQGYNVMAGDADTYIAYGKQWAQVSNTPFRKYKHWVHEGGIATPLIIHWQKGIKEKNKFRTQPGHVIDIMPTVLELANAKYPNHFRENKITPVSGISLVPGFSNKSLVREALFWEHEMNRAVRMGKWKLVSSGELSDGIYGRWKFYNTGPWELYDMENDRNELNDLAGQHPGIVKLMADKWLMYANLSNVFPTPWRKL